MGGWTHLRRGPRLAWLAVLVPLPLGAAALKGQVATPGAVVEAPVVTTVEPTIVGVGTKVRLRGRGLGTARDSAVEFGGGVLATWIERHTPEEIVVRVPVGAEAGPVRVVVGTGGAERPAGKAGAGSPAERGRAAVATSPRPLVVVAPFVEPLPPGRVVPTGNGLTVRSDRVIVDLADFLGFEDAGAIAQGMNGRVAGFFGPSNTYVVALKEPARDYAALGVAMAPARADGRVVDVCPDLMLGLKQVTFANTDVVDRYRQTRTPPNGSINGREDVWHFDRAQAPAAWNLVRRFVPAPAAVKIAVLDTGCDQTHAEFAGVTLRQIAPPTRAIQLTLTGGPLTLPVGITEEPYNRGDADGHGTAVCSLIGAANGAAIPGAPNGDRGINGVLTGGGGACTIQVHRGSSGNFPNEPGEPGIDYALTDFLAAINGAALTTPAGRVTVLNASWGQPLPIDPNTHPDRGIVRVSLRKLALQMNVFQSRLLLCVAAGNEGGDPGSYNGGEVTPFEDFNLNGVLDAGEDADGDGALDHGNYVAASLGTLPNVITIGAIGGPDGVPRTRDDDRAGFSNFGSRRVGTPNDVVVQLAAGGVECLVAAIPGSGFAIGNHRFRLAAGTSFSTPQVTGSAGLLLAIDSTLTPAQVKTRLIASSLPIDTATAGVVGPPPMPALPLRWNTLKVGAAARRLLVDRGIIGNGQAWTGTSKLLRLDVNTGALVATLVAEEMRQDPVTRRSERFRDTVMGVVALVPRGLPPPSPTLYPSDAGGLSWDGTRVAFEVNSAVQELDLAGGATRLVRAGDAYGSWRLPYVANRRVMSGRALPELICTGIPPGNPGFLSYWLGFSVFDEAIGYANSQAVPAMERWGWEVNPAPKPDNKSVYVGYRILHFVPRPGEPWPCVSEYVVPDGFLGTTLPYAGTPPYVLTSPPGAPAPHWFLPDWSPDGRMFAASDNPAGGGGVLRVLRFGPTGAEAWAGVMGHALWSPDGSEILLVGTSFQRRNGSEPIPAGPSRNKAWSW